MEQRKSVTQSGTVSFGDSLSLSTSQDGSGKLGRGRKSHMLKLQRRQENIPQRRLLFRPKTYDWWKEGDLDFEVAENEKLLRNIMEKEKRLMSGKKKSAEHDEFSDSDDEGDLIKHLEKLKSRKQRETEYRQKLEDDKRKREEEEMAELEDKLKSEMQNPSIYGWYFTDGYYEEPTFFGLRQDLIEKFANEQQQWAEAWGKKYPETFTDKFRRFFWPPYYLCKKKCFRTRGSYLDFPEVIADWPAGIDVNFEREAREYITNRHDLFGLAEDELDELELEEAQAAAEEEMNGEEEPEDTDTDGTGRAGWRGRMGKNIKIDFSYHVGPYDKGAESWYYDDEDGQFYPKRPGFDIEYYYDSNNYCWRHKKKRGKYTSENQQTPYDFYYDDPTGEFIPREEYEGLDEIVYDKKNACFRIHLISASSRRTAKGGIKYTAPPARTGEMSEYEFDDTASVSTITTTIGFKGKARMKPKDYYFDEEYGRWFLLNQAPETAKTEDITFDDNGHRRTRKVEGHWRGLTGLSPDDYYWSDRIRKFTPKPPRQGNKFTYYSKDGVWRKTNDVSRLTQFTSEDIKYFYFDDLEGQFKAKDLSVGSHARYIQGKYSKIWRKVAKPKSGLYPEDFYWDHGKKRWFPKSMRYEMIKNAQLAHTQGIIESKQPAMATLLDMKQHGKDTVQSDFYFDFEEGIFLHKRKNQAYVIDDTYNVFTLESMKTRKPPRRYPHDYYYDLKRGEFLLKEQTQVYYWDDKYHVWKKDSSQDLSSDKKVEGWFFDCDKEEWLRGNSGGMDHILGIRASAKSGKIFPDHYFFNDVDGRFYLKDLHDANTGKYYYDSITGVWKQKGLRPGPDTPDINPRNYFFDDATQMFKMMVRDRKTIDYFFDPRNKLHRHIVASGRSKSGFRPSDFVWNSDFKNFVPITSLKKTMVQEGTGGVQPVEPLREYQKPWTGVEKPPSKKMEEKKAKGKTSIYKWLTGASGATVAPEPVKTKEEERKVLRRKWEKKF